MGSLRAYPPEPVLTGLILLRNAEVYAPEALGRRDVAIAGGTIVAIAPSLPRLPAGYGATEVDLQGLRLIPGLIDGHVHLTGGGGEAGPHTRVPPLALTELTAGGVTSVVGVLGTDDATRSTAELVQVVHGFRHLGISAWCFTGGYHIPPTTLTGTVRGDIALVDAIIGVGEVAISDHRSSQPTLDEVVRLAGEAHVGALMSGKAGVLHLHVGDGVRGLELVRQALDVTELPARVFQPTHVNRRKALFDEALALASRGVPIDITAFPVADGEDAWPAGEALLRYLAEPLPPHLVTVSSDGGGCFPRFDQALRVTGMDIGSPGALARTLASLLQHGAPLERVLPAFTRNVADALRLPGKGRIEVGADADLVVLAGDGTVWHTMARGVWHRFAAQARLRGPFESEAQ